jgi:RNA polymerase sigma factor (sigma-70 family)
MSLENTITIDQLLSELKPLLRETAALHFIEGYTYSEISIKLGANPKTIKKRCERAKAKLREIWQNDC